MKRLAAALAGCLLATACHGRPLATKASDFYGAWKVTKINTVGAVTESEAQMNALLGTTLTIAAEQVMEAGEEPCRIQQPYPTVSLVETRDQVPIQAAPSPAAAGLPAEAPMLDTGCLTVFMVGNHIVFADHGAFYTAERMKP
jgi:hypothetical protein